MIKIVATRRKLRGTKYQERNEMDITVKIRTFETLH